MQYEYGINPLILARAALQAKFPEDVSVQCLSLSDVAHLLVDTGLLSEAQAEDWLTDYLVVLDANDPQAKGKALKQNGLQ